MGLVKLIAMLAVASALVSPVMGCGGKQPETSSPSVEPDPTPTDPDDAPPNVVNNLGFYIKVNSGSKFTSYMSKGATFNTDCSVPTSATTSQDLDCRVDVQEGDLQFHGLDFNFNVPPELCTYMQMTPYYYYNYETGVGPSAITLTVNEAAGSKTVTACSVTTALGVVAGCGGQAEVDINTLSEGSVTCKYDKSKVNGPNCCFGNYRITRNFTGDTVGTEVLDGTWGGSYEACLGGPGNHSWSDKSKEGIPRTLIYYADTGLNDVWKIKSPISQLYGNNYSISNYYGDLDHTHTGFFSATTSTLPYAFAPIDDRDGSSISSLPDKVVLECLDTAFEVKHRIKVSVREWNTYSNFLAYVTSGGTTAASTANTGGVEDGVSCNYSFGGQCNDAYDFDDLLNGLDADMSDTSDLYDMGDPTLRGSYFPSESK